MTLAQQVRRSVERPGAVRTEMTRDTGDSDRLNPLVAAQVIQRRETPDDLVGVAAFLASEESRFITGQVINVDGGMNFG